MRTIRRIARKPAEPAAPKSTAKPRRSVVGPHRQVVADMLATELEMMGLTVLLRLRRRHVGAVRPGPAVAVARCAPNLPLQVLGRRVQPARLRREVGRMGRRSGRECVLFVASRLNRPRYSLATLVPDQVVETMHAQRYATVLSLKRHIYLLGPLQRLPGAVDLG